MIILSRNAARLIAQADLNECSAPVQPQFIAAPANEWRKTIPFIAAPANEWRKTIPFIAAPANEWRKTNATHGSSKSWKRNDGLDRWRKDRFILADRKD